MSKLCKNGKKIEFEVAGTMIIYGKLCTNNNIKCFPKNYYFPIYKKNEYTLLCFKK